MPERPGFSEPFAEIRNTFGVLTSPQMVTNAGGTTCLRSLRSGVRIPPVPPFQFLRDRSSAVERSNTFHQSLSSPPFLILQAGNSMICTNPASRIRLSRVTKGTLLSMAVATMSRSAGSPWNPSGKSATRAAMLGVIGMTSTFFNTTSNQSRNSTFNVMRPFFTSIATSHKLISAMTGRGFVASRKFKAFPLRSPVRLSHQINMCVSRSMAPDDVLLLGGQSCFYFLFCHHGFREVAVNDHCPT